MAKSRLARTEFVARCVAELKKPGITFDQAARNLKVSTVTLWRATGGKGRVLRGEAWNGPELVRAKNEKRKVARSRARKVAKKAKTKAQPRGKRKLKAKAA